MPEGNSLINLGELSKPATVLIEKISNAVGILYEPRRIVKKAGAEAQAAKIQAIARIEITEMEQRGLERLIHQEGRKQQNIEKITTQAIRDLPASAEVEKLEEDWVAHFFKSCDTVSDEEMQSLWARLLAGEATKPGTFSKRTINFVASMNKADARFFTEFCQFVWFEDETSYFPLIYDYSDEIYTSHGINFGILKHLDTIGLVSFEPISGFTLAKLPENLSLRYHNKLLSLQLPNVTDNVIKLGQALLTQTGLELCSVCSSQYNDKYFEYVINRWIINNGYMPSTPILGRITLT